MNCDDEVSIRIGKIEVLQFGDLIPLARPDKNEAPWVGLSYLVDNPGLNWIHGRGGGGVARLVQNFKCNGRG